MVRHKSNSGCNRSVAVSQVYSITPSYVYIYIYILHSLRLYYIPATLRHCGYNRMGYLTMCMTLRLQPLRCKCQLAELPTAQGRALFPPLPHEHAWSAPPISQAPLPRLHFLAELSLPRSVGRNPRHTIPGWRDYHHANERLALEEPFRANVRSHRCGDCGGHARTARGIYEFPRHELHLPGLQGPITNFQSAHARMRSSRLQPQAKPHFLNYALAPCGFHRLASS